MKDFNTIQKNSAPEMVAGQILNKIKEGELQPGGRLPAQRELAQMMGVGRSSVREAINALVVMGYLEALQGKGTFVRKPIPATPPADTLAAAMKAGTVLDLMEARILLECKSAELAAERAEPADIRKLKEVIRRVKATKNNYSIFLKADIDFHTCLAGATGNTVIGEMTRLVLEKVVAHHSRLQTTLLTPAYRTFSIHSAKMVVDCVESGRGADAALWMRRHLDAINEELKDIF